MNKIKLLIQGKAMFNNAAEWHEDYSAVVLIERSNGEKIIFDPGCNRELLLKSLEENDLKPEDVNYVFLSHKHIDHMMLMGIFEKANIVTGNSFYEGARFKRHNKDVWDDIKMIYTPGHIEDHYCLIVDTVEGKYCLAGDLWWFSEGEQPEFSKENIDELINFKDPVGKDEASQISSRKRIIKEKVDFIIPGHGKIINL